MVNKNEKEQYREIVRRVLKAMGYKEPTYGDFRLWDGLIDWRATATLIDQPHINTAICYILDQRGKIVKCKKKPVIVARDVVASTKAEADKILAKESLKFVSWWPSDLRPDADDNQREVCDNNENEQDTLKDYRNRTFAATRDFFAGRKRIKRASKEVVVLEPMRIETDKKIDKFPEMMTEDGRG